MTMPTYKQHLTACLLLLATSPLAADQAYTWTDSDGVTHFSESVPSDSTHDTQPIELKSAPVIPGMAPERYRSINEQATRMESERLKREQARQKRRQIAAKQRQAFIDEYETERQAYPEQYYFFAYPYWHHPHHRQYRYPRHHHPRHMPPRDRYKPGKSITQQRNAEALRDYRRRW